MDLWTGKRVAHPLAISSHRSAVASLWNFRWTLPVFYRSLNSCACLCVCVSFCRYFRGEVIHPATQFWAMTVTNVSIFSLSLFLSWFRFEKWLKWWRSCLRCRWSIATSSSCTKTIRCSRVSMTPTPALCHHHPDGTRTALVPGTDSLPPIHLTSGYQICTITTRIVLASHPAQVCIITFLLLLSIFIIM